VTAAVARDAPSPDADQKPDSPDDLTRRSWKYVLRKTAREFGKDQCTDNAAALTYYAVLALFPGLIALMSLVGLLGQGDQAALALLEILRDTGAGSIADTLEPTLLDLSGGAGAGLALVTGLAAALWSASGYVGSFGRAMNRIHETTEGRPFWKLRPWMLGVTVVEVVLAALVLTALVVTGPAAEAVGSQLGLEDSTVLIWSIAKWPVLLAVVVVMVALLYYATPNVQQPRFRWISVGAALAIVVWLLASAGFGLYVGTFASYDRTYGSLAGVIVFLLWLWLTNLALLFGAELDSELERGRELQAGLPAERRLQLPPRDTTGIEKAEAKEREDVRRGQALRESRGRDDDEEGDTSSRPPSIAAYAPRHAAPARTTEED